MLPRRSGLVAMAIGIVLFAITVVLLAGCNASSSGVCTRLGFGVSVLAIAAGLGGAAVFLVGLRLVLPAVTPPVLAANSPGLNWSSAYCYVCGQGLDRAGGEGRWYCHRCGAYR